MRRHRVPGERLFRLLLRVHPRAFRERYGDEMVEVFRDGWRAEAAGRGLPAAVAFWARTTRATVRAGIDQRRTRGGGMGSLTKDLVVVLRALRRRPAFSTLVIATFALGMGANTAVFSVLHGVLLSPLPYEESDRLVRAYWVPETEPDARGFVPGMAFIELRERAPSLDLVAFYNYQAETADLTGGDRPESVRILRAGTGYLDLLGAPPMVGRWFRPDEERSDAYVAVVRQNIWERYLGADPNAVGRASVTLEGVSYTVIGVVAEPFRDPLDDDVDIWIPQDLARGGSNNFDNYYLTVLGRLPADASLEGVQHEVTAITRRFAELDQDAEGEIMRLVPLRDDLVGEARPLLAVVAGAAGFLLLIACVNVASLFLIRGASLRTEMAVRTALGSGRGRLVRQILLESVTLSVAGGLAGLLLGGILHAGLLSLAPVDLPRLDEIAFGGVVFVYGAALSVLAGILFGLIPALRYSRTASDHTLADTVRGSESHPAHQRVRSVLVVTEIGLALVLLIGAGLLLRSLHQLRTVDLGFQTADVQTFPLHLPDGRYDDPLERARLHRTLSERLAAIPGVARAGAVSDLPGTGEAFRWGTGLSDASGGRDVETFIGANQRAVEGDYFEALGIPLLAGRAFAPEDDAAAPHTVVVNRALTERLWPGRSPADVIGEELWYGGWNARVVGVVGNPAIDARGRIAPLVHHAHRQFAENRNWEIDHVVRLESPVPDLATAIRREVAALDPWLVVGGVRPLAEVVGRGVARERFATLLLTAFSAVAVLLAAVGVYGVLAYAVARRRREIALRVALGADRPSVRRMVVGEGLRISALGIAIGIPVAFGLSRWITGFMFEVSPRDPWIFTTVPLGLLAVALVASWVPAFRATRLDPAEALRGE